MPIFISDEPTLDDLLERKALIQEIGDSVADCQPPCVFGIHGDWGSGKTSFLHQLELYLSGECPACSHTHQAIDPKKAWGTDWKLKDNVAVIWFEAWRYQHEPAPIVALLQEIRASLPAIAQARNAAKKWLSIGVKSVLLGFDKVTQWIGVQASKVHEVREQWQKEHLAEELPSHTLRNYLQDSIGQMLKQIGVGGKAPRLVVLIDDLDRCESQAAYRLLEGIKIYLNLPNCVFVLGVNQHSIEASLAEQLAKEKSEKPSEEARQRARDYLDKICKNFWHLPPYARFDSIAHAWLRRAGVGEQSLAVEAGDLIGKYKCLPANPRRIKGFLNTLARFLDRQKEWQPPPGLQDEQAREKSHVTGLIVVLAYLYQFHPDIYRVIEWDPAYFQVLQQWCEKPDGHVQHDLLIGLKRDYVNVLFDSSTSNDPPDSVGRPEKMFPDPARGNVLRVQKLIQELGAIADHEIASLLLK